MDLELSLVNLSPHLEEGYKEDHGYIDLCIDISMTYHRIGHEHFKIEGSHSATAYPLQQFE